MNIKAFSTDIKIMPILTDIAAASANRSSEVIDTLGYDGVCIVLHMGTIATGAATVASLLHADAASNETTLTSSGAVEGTSQTIADDDDGQAFVWDVIKPTKRYYQLFVDKDATNNSEESAIAYLYRCKSTAPATHAAGGTGAGTGSGTVTVERYVSPPTGTI